MIRSSRTLVSALRIELERRHAELVALELAYARLEVAGCGAADGTCSREYVVPTRAVGRGRRETGTDDVLAKWCRVCGWLCTRCERHGGANACAVALVAHQRDAHGVLAPDVEVVRDAADRRAAATEARLRAFAGADPGLRKPSGRKLGDS